MIAANFSATTQQSIVLACQAAGLDEQATACELVANYIQTQLDDQPGPIVGFFANEIADMLGVSTGDVLGWTKDIARRWWIDGQRVNDYRDMVRLSRMLGSEWIEVEILRQDAGQLRQALQLD